MTIFTISELKDDVPQVIAPVDPPRDQRLERLAELGCEVDALISPDRQPYRAEKIAIARRINEANSLARHGEWTSWLAARPSLRLADKLGIPAATAWHLIVIDRFLQHVRIHMPNDLWFYEEYTEWSNLSKHAEWFRVHGHVYGVDTADDISSNIAHDRNDQHIGDEGPTSQEQPRHYDGQAYYDNHIRPFVTRHGERNGPVD